MMNAASLQAIWSDIQSKINPMMTKKWHDFTDSMFWKNTAWEIQKLKESINDATDITKRASAVKKALWFEIKTQSDVDKLKNFMIEDWKFKKEKVETLDKTIIQDPQKFKKFLMREDVYADTTMRSTLWFNRAWEVDRVLGSKSDPTKESTTSNDATTAVNKTTKEVWLKELSERANVESQNWMITKIWNIKIVNNKVENSKYKEVAEKLIKYDKVKNSDKESFNETFEKLWIEKNEVDEIWKEIENLKNPPTN